MKLRPRALSCAVLLVSALLACQGPSRVHAPTTTFQTSIVAEATVSIDTSFDHAPTAFGGCVTVEPFTASTA